MTIRTHASAFIRENFDPDDRLATVLVNRRTGHVIQRIASARSVASASFLEWLHRKNAERYEVYVSMNALHPEATGRTKVDIASIRHVFLDFDQNGTRSVNALLERTDVPPPAYLVHTSPDKWQAIWKVQNFTAEAAENLQRTLARQTGADIAATDCARVMRLPDFCNHKYGDPYLVTAERFADGVYGPEKFPVASTDHQLATRDVATRRAIGTGTISQSEKDWAFAKRALARGDSPEAVVAAIAVYRRHDKHNAKYYAELTVQKASASLAAERMGLRNEGPDR